MASNPMKSVNSLCEMLLLNLLMTASVNARREMIGVLF